MYVDIAIICIIAISAIFGLMRGLVKEALSLVAWILALWIAWNYCEQFAHYFSDYLKQPDLQIIASFCVIFVLALIALSLIKMLIERLFEFVGLTGIDRSLGFVFGVARGVLIVAVLILGAYSTALTNKPFWQSSQLVNHFIPVTNAVRSFIPHETRVRIPEQQPVTSG